MGKIADKLMQFGELVTVKRGKPIYQTGEKINSFYYIEKGIVKLAADSLDGKTTTISLNESNEFFGYLEYLKGCQEYTRYAVALTDCILYSMPIDLLHNPYIRESFIFDSLIQQLEKAEQLNFVLSTMTVSERLRWLLLKMAKDKEGVLLIESPLTHEEMANYLGCSRQKISNYLSKWKKDGALSYDSGIIMIVDVEKLQ